MNEQVTPLERQHEEPEADITTSLQLPQQRTADDPAPPETSSRWRYASAVQAARALRR